MKLISVLLLSFALTGCYQTVSIHDIERGIAKCQSLGESVESITADMVGTEFVRCNKTGKSYPI